MYKNIEEKIGWNFHNSYTKLPEKLFSRTKPKKVKDPEIYILNKNLAKDLGLDPDLLDSKEGAEILGGIRTPQGADPLAQAYAGHQFGHFTMLGDGRAVLLGEHLDPKGNKYDIQLKGSGKTPYSRGGDGRAALGPMLREYIISEAMTGLGISTTRSLAVATTGETILREEKERAAILTRIASSHIRVGSFQYALAYGDRQLVKELADYTINRHYPHLTENDSPYLGLLKEVIKKQASLISKWQLVGFIHGVMNTDNMAISGETIDYGPCAFMDIYNPNTVFSSIDRYGRYAYGNQANIGAWNLARFGETLIPLISNNQEEAIKLVEKEIDNYFNIYKQAWLEGFSAKLGIFQTKAEDSSLVSQLLSLMEKYKLDYTNLFRALSLDDYSNFQIDKLVEFIDWKDRWEERLSAQDKNKDEIRELMKAHNPSIIPRNIWVEEALRAAEKDNKKPMLDLLKVLEDPYAYTEAQETYARKPIPRDINYRTFCGT